MKNTLKNRRIEFHILQSFPATCLNRDDVGSPKSAIIGGVNRARVSSQCWKRQIRLALQEVGIKLGLRTKHIQELMLDALVVLGADENQAKTCADLVAKELADDTLIFVSQNEIDIFAEHIKAVNFDASEIKPKELAKLIKKNVNYNLDALDISLFGRMVAKAADMNVEAAASFSHAISTHKVASDMDFFTAIDDCRDQYKEDVGSAHMGTLEFNSATYYRYISLDLGQLAQNLGFDNTQESTEQMQQAIEAFTKALFIAVPAARQTTQSGACPWEYAKVLVRKGQGLQMSFDAPVKIKSDGAIKPSKEALQEYLSKKEKLAGSLFGKIGAYEWGENENYSIDNLIDDLTSHVE